MYSGIHPNFLENIAEQLISLVGKARKTNPQNQPYAAGLFRIPAGHDLNQLHEIGENRGWAYNQRGELCDHNAHAELLLVRRPEIAMELYKVDTNKPLNERPKYCIFTNAPSCPMCMTALINSQIQYIFYFVDIDDNRKLPLHPMCLAQMYRHKLPFVVEQVPCDSAVHERLKTQLNL